MWDRFGSQKENEKIMQDGEKEKVRFELDSAETHHQHDWKFLWVAAGTHFLVGRSRNNLVEIGLRGRCKLAVELRREREGK
jgi:hypothetical protein